MEEGIDALKNCIDKCPECTEYRHEGTLLHTAAASGTPEMIEYIVKNGGIINLNHVEKEWTPICWAIAEKKMDNVKKLIELGAMREIKNFAQTLNGKYTKKGVKKLEK